MIPIIDISPLVNLDDCSSANSRISDVTTELDRVIKSIANACQTVGFFAITNHGVDAAIIDAAWKASDDFFDLDSAIKQSVPMTGEYPYGYENYESLGIERSSASSNANKKQATKLLPDSKETFSLGPSDASKSNMPPRKFPSSGASSNNFEPALTRYYSAMEHLAQILFRGLAMALKLDDISWFLHKGRFDDGHQCALRILNYPELEYIQTDVSKIHIRAGAHTDYGAMTILKSGGPGLQLQLSKDSDSSTWIDVPHLEDSFIINLGDLMQRWTNDRWKSTLHRVVAVANTEDADNRTNEDGGENLFRSARRQSIAFFVNMNGNATVVPLDTCVDEEHPSRYEPIKASEHLLQRHRQSMASKANK